MDVLKIADRKHIIQQLDSDENKHRKAESFKQCEIYSDRMYQYVSERLREFNKENTVKEIPIIASINLARRIVKEESSIYKECPQRSLSGSSDDQQEVAHQIYQDMGIDSKLMRSNELYKLQSQGMIQIIPKDGKLKARVLKMHHFDAIPDPNDPERALAIIISGFDRSDLMENYKDRTATGFQGRSATHRKGTTNMHNEDIADPDDSMIEKKRLVWWTEGHHFMTNGRGEIIDDSGAVITDPETDLTNPLGMLPFVDIAMNKDFEYFVREGSMITDFTVDFNSILSEMEQVMRMQGFSVGVLKAPDALMPENIVVGPNNILKLTVDVETQGETDFSYASPNADIPGSIQLTEFILASFLSSRGLDPSTVSGKPSANKSSSGIERLLSMIEKFEATKEDYNLYEYVEKKIWKIVKGWHNSLIDTETLDQKYRTTAFSEDAEISVMFNTPEMVQTQKEQMELISLKLDEGLMSKVDAIMELENIKEPEAAQERLMEIEKLNMEREDAISKKEKNQEEETDQEVGEDADQEE